MPEEEYHFPRYKCGACGNLTRWDVTTTVRTRAFHHYTLGGELNIEEPEVLLEDIEAVSCRWCGHGNNVEVQHEQDGEWTRWVRTKAPSL